MANRTGNVVRHGTFVQNDLRSSGSSLTPSVLRTKLPQRGYA